MAEKAIKATKEQKASLLSNILAIIGFIIVIVIVIWGLLYAATMSRSWFASFFSNKNNSSNTTSPATVSLSAIAGLLAAESKPSDEKTSVGLPDLSVQILSEGVIDPVSGNIISRRTTSYNDVVAVKFDITNNGSASTGPWYFTAELPTLPAYTYTSPAQDSLAPGAHIESTLRFAQVPFNGGAFTVSTDPSNLVLESNEGNNTASKSI